MAEEKEKKQEQGGAGPAVAGQDAVTAQAPAAVAPVAAGPDAILGEMTADGKPLPKPVRPKGARHVPFGIVHVRATFNNTVVAVSDPKGNIIGWSSSGRAGFKGARKSTAFAASVVGQEAARQALLAGVREVEVRVQGPGAGRETAIRALQSAGLSISVIKDVTPVPHNGCRPRKRRRV